MKASTTRLLAVAIVLVLAISMSKPVEAAASPGFNSTYSLDYRLYGSTHFRVRYAPAVKVVLRGTYGPTRSVTIQIQRQVCGTFGCHWNSGGGFVGGTCTRTLQVGVTATCYFNPPISAELHRIVMTKANDYRTIKGTVSVS